MRPLAWHDLPTIYHHRHEVLPLNSALALTRGNPVGITAAIRQLHPRRGSFIGVSDAPKAPSAIGQISYDLGERSARISFLMPRSAFKSSNLADLLEGLAAQAGEWGAFNLLAEVEEINPAFDKLREIGFSVYAWQRIWKCPQAPENLPDLWQPVIAENDIIVRSMYQSVLPPLVLSAEPAPEKPQGLLYRLDGEVMGFVDVCHGPNGIFLLPLFYPAAGNPQDAINSLACHLSRPLSQPIFLAVRSYQGWVEEAMEGLQWQPAPRQALLVKRLAISQRVNVPNHAHAVIEQHRAEPTTPIIGYVHPEGKEN
jgi:hypothetical protein